MNTGTKLALFSFGGIAITTVAALLILGACIAGGLFYLFRTHDVTHDPSVKTDFVPGRIYTLQQDADLLSVKDSDGKQYNFIQPIDPANPHGLLPKGTTIRFDRIMRKENFEIGKSTYAVMTIMDGTYKNIQATASGICHQNESTGEIMVDLDFLK